MFLAPFLQLSLILILGVYLLYITKTKNLQCLYNALLLEAKSFFCIVSIRKNQYKYRFFPASPARQTLAGFFAGYSGLDSLLCNISLAGEKSFVVELESDNDFYICYGQKQQKRTMIIIYFEHISKQTRIIRNIEAKSQKSNAQSIKYKDILDNIPYPVWQRDQNLQIEYCNSPYLEYLKNNSFDSSMEISRYSQDLAQNAFETEKPVSSNFYLTSANEQNEQRLFKFMETPLRNITIGVANDITQSEQNKKELAKYIIAHHNLLENSSSAMALYRSDRKLLFYNNAFAKLWDLDRKWLDSQPCYEEILENLRDKQKLPEQANFKKFKDDQINLFSNLLQTHHEFLHLPDGRTLRSFIIPHPLGGLLFSYEDMSDRLNMLRSYNALVAVKKATLNNLSEAISVFGEDGKLKLHNHVYADIWNLGNEFLESNPHISTVLDHTKHLYKDKDSWVKFRDYFMLQFTSRNKACIRLQLKNSLILDISIIPLPDGATLFTYLDVTDSFLVERSLRERNEILEKTEKLKSEFLTSISYELRSPLTSIMGFAEMLANGYAGKLSEKQAEYVNDLSLSSNQLKRLIDDVLDLVSIETGHTTLKKEKFDIYQLIDSVAASAKGLADKLGSQINLECSSKIGKMTGDKIRVRYIVHKLLLKAINSSNKLNKISLSARKKNDNLEIDIEYRDGASSIDTNDLSGFDLNLLVADRLAKLHGGSVAFSITPEGLSQIICKLPIGQYESIK